LSFLPEAKDFFREEFLAHSALHSFNKHSLICSCIPGSSESLTLQNTSPIASRMGEGDFL
jgi:hypothetical protein